MTAQGLSRIAGGVALVAVLVIAGLVARSALRGTEPDFVPQLAGGPAAGDLTGYLGRIDPRAGTIDVAQDPGGLHPMSLVVTGETAITLHGQPVRLGDLSKDMPVRVSYEVRDDVKYATAVEATDAAPVARATVAPPAGVPTGGAPETRSPDSGPAGEATAGAEPKALAPPPASPIAPPPTPPVVQPPPSRAPSSPAPAHASAVPQAASLRPTSRATGPATASGAPTPRRPADSDVGDGTAAIDWLFGGAGRR